MNEAGDNVPRRDPAPWMAYSPVLMITVLLAASWNSPVLDQHGFRQAQTLVSAYWMAHGGPWLLYQTPILGHPWAIPFEFPLYQWLVALAAGLPGMNVDTAGRVVSAAALVACLWPLRRLLRGAGAPPRLLDWATFLFLLSPIHLFWGRSAMIESTALLLSLLFAEAIQRLTLVFRWRWVALAVLWASLAALVKITTMFAFALLAAGMVVVVLARELRQSHFRESLRLAAAALGSVLVAVLALLAWLHVGDSIKLQSPLTAFVTSANLSGWNLDRAPLLYIDAFWRDVVLGRMVPEILGYSAWLALGGVVLLTRRRIHWLGAAALALLLFVAPMLVFTKLHYLHNYYQMANAVFLVVALAFVLHGVSETWSNRSTVVLAAAAAVGMLLQFQAGYWTSIAGQDPNNKVLVLSELLRRHTDPTDVVVTFGLEWSAEVPYYAQRRSLMLMQNESMGLVPSLLRAPDASTLLPVGAIVRCGVERPEITLLLPLLCSKASEIEAGGCSIIVRRPGSGRMEPGQCQAVLARAAETVVRLAASTGLAKAAQELETQSFQPFASCNVDFIGGLEGADPVRGRDENLVLRGWFIEPGTGTRPIARVLRLRSQSQGRSWLAPLGTAVPRPDLESSYGRAGSETGGFETDLPLTLLPPGRYEISLLDQGSVPTGECVTGKLLFVN